LYITDDGKVNGGRHSFQSFEMREISNVNIKYQKYTLLSNRLQSLMEWPKSISQSPQELASAGFFYTGNSDRVICFFCGLGLKDWDLNDIPIEQHAMWAPQCQFVIMKEEFVSNVFVKKAK
jgi:baculoviral IAP repeat-containing protein 7/8